MKVSKNTLFVFILMYLLTIPSIGQKNQLSIGAQIPLYYTISYEENIFKGLNLGLTFGWLDKPFSNILIDEAIQRGLEQRLGELLKKQFSIGYSSQIYLKYNFKYFYAGAFYAATKITATELPYTELADIYNIDISAITSSQYSFLINDPDLTSKLILPGIFVGKEFKIPNTQFSLGVEIGFQKIITSKSEIVFASSLLNGQDIQEVVQTQLDDFYTKEGDIGSINIRFNYQFTKSIKGLFAKPTEKL